MPEYLEPPQTIGSEQDRARRRLTFTEFDSPLFHGRGAVGADQLLLRGCDADESDTLAGHDQPLAVVLTSISAAQDT
jgi:hypothetical protein